MSNTLNKVFIFAAGAVLGSVVTWRLLETKYIKLAQEEIDTYKEEFEQRMSENSSETETEEQEPTEAETIETPSYSEVVDGLNYTSYSKTETNGDDSYMTKGKSYVIAPDECGEDDYEIETLVLYSDGVLADMQYNKIDDVEGMVGRENLKRIGEYEPDLLHVRNDGDQTDYEIQYDNRSYVFVAGDSED